MQNAVNQNKQTRIAPLRSAASYLFRFGNYRGNGLATQILLYLAISCFLTKQQIRAFQLTINELRFIRCTSLVTVSAVITHMARHSFGTLMLTSGISIESISKMMGHSSISSTQIYAKVTDDKISEDMDKLIERRKTMEKATVLDK